MRSEKYRRAVASLPCVHCGIEGRSQAAHANGIEYGKGMGIKADDSALFPLCADAPGVRGCHSLFDQGALFTKAERREVQARWISWAKTAVANLNNRTTEGMTVHSIWKFTLAIDDRQYVAMPKGAQILALQTQGDVPQLWALVDPTAPVESRVFDTYGTGHSSPTAPMPGSYIGTYQLRGGSSVFHVFEQLPG